MSKLDIKNLTNTKTKLDFEKLKEICFLFSKDFIATRTANNLTISRQTVNAYYKTFRELLFNQLVFIDKNQADLTISYIKIHQDYFYYLEKDFTLIENNNSSFYKLEHFIKNHLHNTFLRNKKINRVKLIYSHHKKDFLTLGFYSSSQEIDQFVNSRLKKFRGINKKNIQLHIKESLFRFQHSQSEIYNNLIKIFNLK
jgi:transposase-like protein